MRKNCSNSHSNSNGNRNNNNNSSSSNSSSSSSNSNSSGGSSRSRKNSSSTSSSTSSSSSSRYTPRHYRPFCKHGRSGACRGEGGGVGLRKSCFFTAFHSGFKLILNPAASLEHILGSCL